MTVNTRRSRLPPGQDLSREMTQFLDGIDVRQGRVADIEDPADTATTAELAAAIRAILAAHRTR